MARLRVKNWRTFQHYKDRCPPWIKLHRDVLDDPAFDRLTDAQRWHLVGIWLMASRNEGRIDDDPSWVGRRINATDPVDLEALVEAGWLVREHDASTTLAPRLQDASTALAPADVPVTTSETPCLQDASTALALARSREERRGEKRRGDQARETRPGRTPSDDQETPPEGIHPDASAAVGQWAAALMSMQADPGLWYWGRGRNPPITGVAVDVANEVEALGPLSHSDPEAVRMAVGMFMGRAPDQRRPNAFRPSLDIERNATAWRAKHPRVNPAGQEAIADLLGRVDLSGDRQRETRSSLDADRTQARKRRKDGVAQ